MLLLGAKWSACFDRKLKWCGCGESNGHYDIFVYYIKKNYAVYALYLEEK